MEAGRQGGGGGWNGGREVRRRRGTGCRQGGKEVEGDGM